MTCLLPPSRRRVEERMLARQQDVIFDQVWGSYQCSMVRTLLLIFGVRTCL